MFYVYTVLTSPALVVFALPVHVRRFFRLLLAKLFIVSDVVSVLVELDLVPQARAACVRYVLTSV